MRPGPCARPHETLNHQPQGDNVKRSRGRGRRPQNNHNRAFDSTGPDVKIRGTASHVYEKYLQLARDAGSAGDRVMAENYLQPSYPQPVNSAPSFSLGDAEDDLEEGDEAA